MGNKLYKEIEKKDISQIFINFKNHISHEKIEFLKLLNNDYIIDKISFCSFFLCNEEFFDYFDQNKSGTLNILEIFMYLILMSDKNISSKINEIIKLFNFSEPAKVFYSEIMFMFDIFILCTEKMFYFELLDDTKEEIYTFCDQLFGDKQEKILKEVTK